jgi:hypothetical protein
LGGFTVDSTHQVAKAVHEIGTYSVRQTATINVVITDEERDERQAEPGCEG